MPSKREIITDLIEAGESHISQKNWQEATDLLLKALKLCDGVQKHASQVQVLKLLAQAFEGNEDAEASLKYYKLFMESEREMLSSEVQRAIESQFDERVKKVEEEWESYRIRVEQLQKESEDSSKRLTSLSEQISENNGLLVSLRERLVDLKNANGNSNSLIEGIIDEINSRSKGADAWNNFESQLQMLDPGFTDQLTTIYPLLTSAEVRICLLLKINLSTKEIGALLDISDRTVDTHRTSIRKKIKLGRGQNLMAALTTL